MAPDIILLVAVAAVVIRMAVLHGRLRALEAQVIRDPRTGAFNRRHMQVTLAAAVERRRRSGEPASLLLIDIDRFKEANDLFGHGEGDPSALIPSREIRKTPGGSVYLATSATISAAREDPNDDESARQRFGRTS